MSPLLIDDIVRSILTSRVYDVAIESPLDHADKLSRQMNCSVYLKREDMQSVHSFKLRGAYNKIVNLTSAERKKGVIAASAGNHGQGVALAAQRLGIDALIIMPRTTPAIKIDAVRGYGAAVELAGDNYSEAAEYCKKRIQETDRTYIHPFDDPLVIAGQGTIGREIVEQLPAATHVFVPVGGGGLIAGIASYIKALRPDIQVIGVEPEDSNAMQESVIKKERIELSHVGIFADGVAVKQVGLNTFPVALHKVDDFITVNTDQICSAIKNIFEDTRSIVEPAGALAVAGIVNYDLPKNAHTVAICSGANMTFERLQQVTERTLLGSGREALLSVSLTEQPGALSRFCNEIVRSRNITEFSYRKHDKQRAQILIGITVDSTKDRGQLIDLMREKDYNHEDLSHDDTTKEHVRHMVGGQAPTLRESMYEITFPERPGALIDFLRTVGDAWNISMFHYRSAASDTGRVLIGFETEDASSLETRLDQSHFGWKRVNDNIGIRTFL
jgi:threonine dehydratase